MVNATRPLTAVAVPPPGEVPTPVPVVAPVTLQTFVLPASRVIVITVLLSLATRLPFASVTSICIDDTDALSDAMGFVRNVAFVFAADPTPPLVMMTLQPVRPTAEAES